MAELTQALEQLNTLRAAYSARLAEKLDSLAAGRRALSQTLWNPAHAVALHREAHNLAGSGATFGFDELSAAARALEAALLPLRDQAAPPSDAQLALVDATLATVVGAVGALASADAPPPVDAPPSADAPPPALRAEHIQALMVLEEDEQAGASLAQQLGYFGYAVCVVRDLAALPDLARAIAPRAVIMDLDGHAEERTSAALAALRAAVTAPPIIFLSRRADLAARLTAVRAGGSAFLARPVDISDLVLVLDALTNLAEPEPYRVLIVDDSSTVARRHALILGAAGMQVAVVTDPANLLEALADQEPDLVLMDMYLPGCEGHELAAIIRQQAAFHGMPIVFLSGEKNREIQLAAMGQGGDDFLTKPVMPAHLVAAVKSRVERARAIRGQLNRDSLTGLLTHGATNEQLARELLRIRRYGGVVSIAMIDVDNFKRVNDTYGHAVGDRVLKSLARLLRQQLRASDVIGRYGGEEFVVLLPETAAAAALAVLDRVRAQFAQIQHQAGAIAFTTTFSAGVAALVAPGDLQGVLAAADAALYTAKGAGRNRVVLADA